MLFGNLVGLYEDDEDELEELEELDDDDNGLLKADGNLEPLVAILCVSYVVGSILTSMIFMLV